MYILFDSPQFGPLEFMFRSGDRVVVFVCNMCGHTRRDTLTPVRSFDPEAGEIEERYEQTGATLCEVCCKSADIGAGWWGHTFEEMGRLWAFIREEQAREAAEIAGRERAASLQDLQRATAALQKAPAHQGVNQMVGA